MELGERIKAIRKGSGNTQKEFASALCVSANYIYLMESGKEKPSDRTLNDICRIYGVNKEWLEYGSGEPYAQKTNEEIIAQLFGEVTQMDDDSFTKQFITVLAKMNKEQRDVFESIGKMMIDERKK